MELEKGLKKPRDWRIAKLAMNNEQSTIIKLISFFLKIVKEKDKINQIQLMTAYVIRIIFDLYLRG